MKKGLLFGGLIIAITLLCCYALVAADAVQNSDATLSKETASSKQDPAATQKVDIDELYQRIQELKSQGLYDPQLWADYDDLTSQPTRPPRHTDQGGDDCANATAVTEPLPYNDGGGTCNYTDDYTLGIWGDGCPYSANDAPDVVYVYSPSANVTVDISLCGSSYDTKLWVYDGTCVEANVIACDDDGCDSPTGLASIIEGLALTAGHDYYIIVDGYSDNCGDYVIAITGDGGQPCDPDYSIEVDCQGSIEQGNTCNAGDDCNTRDSEDEIWEIEILQDGEYNFSLCNTDPEWDSKIYLDSECCGTSHIASDDDGCGYPLSEITCVALTTGDIVYLLIEGYGASDCGAYQLDITCCDPPPPPPECPDNTLYGQRPHMPDDPWTGAVSDLRTGSGYSELIRYESFSGVNEPICDIHWWSFIRVYDFGWQECDENPMSFEIKFYPGVAGADLPDVDNPVCTYDVTLTAEVTGLDYYGRALYYWSTTLEPCCSISDGWVSIQGTSVSSPTDCWFLWMSSPDGDGTSLLYNYEPPGSWTTEGFDLSICLTEEEELDLGDLHTPCNYPSLPWASMGHPAGNYNPGHILSGIAWLGASISGELWADPAGHDNNVMVEAPVGDGTDDGVVFYPPYFICQWEVVDVTVTAGPNYHDEQLWLNAWKDGNMDGDFDDDNLEYCQASEWIIQDMPVTPGFYPQIPFLDPGLFALVPYEPIFRFRLTSQAVGRHGYGLVDPLCPNMANGTGPAVDYLGEVEDYNVIMFFQLPVELTTLEAIAGDRQVTLSWTTASEQNNAYFEVQRMSPSSDWTTVGQVDGSGNSQTAINYEYTDQAVVNGVTYTYRLLSHDINGTVHEYEQTAEATPEAPMPREYALDQNFPNPFNPNTSISYSLMEAGFVTLKIYNLMGQEVATLVSQRMESGRYTATFTATDLPSGIYVYRLDVNDFTATKKMVLMK